MKRRDLLVTGASAIGAGAVGWTVGSQQLSASKRDSAQLHGDERIDFHGKHQAALSVDAQAHGSLLAFNLLGGTQRADLVRLMRVLSDDARRFMAGDAALADIEPEMVAKPARLTVAFGFGPGFVSAAQGSAPGWLAPLPAFGIDRLDPAWCGGDLFVEVAGDDPVVVAHVVRQIQKDTKSFATQAWIQRGFRSAYGTQKTGTTMRNLFGQVDGSANFAVGTKAFDDTVWIRDGSWLDGGTSVVVRRIDLNLDGWDKLARSERERVVGRTLDTGAPLTGHKESDTPDLDATDATGLKVIPEFSHLRRARMVGPKIHRRGFNYENGLVFCSYQADVEKQFIPIQRSLDELDLLNTWTTPVGSAVFVMPPGCGSDGYVGETLLS